MAFERQLLVSYTYISFFHYALHFLCQQGLLC
uniref:Uncharacterized protein n=1 Tax=Arundo donax TaxID=35708 RepID=A0A0A9F359_ARUDO